MDEIKVFIPISKIDEEQRLVYGQMTAEVADSVGEIWDYEGSKPYFEDWSATAEKNSGGQSLGNLRSMHQPIAAGKLTQFIMDDESKSVQIAAKVVDDAEWGKVLEGVYTGFSQGGRYIKRWKDPDDAKKTRYISSPVEVSLVDVPCLSTATFEYVKSDGSVELRKFNNVKEPIMYEPTNEEVAARATQMAKAAGDETKWADHIEAACDALKAEHAPEPVVEPVVETDPVVEPEADATKVDEPEPEAEKAAAEEDDSETDEEKKAKAKKAARDSLVQKWHTPDGKSFVKAADAVAHIVGETEAPPLTPVQEALKAAREAAGEGGEPVLVKFEPTEGLDTAVVVIGELVEKGLWDAGRSLEVLQSVISLQCSAAWEAEYEKDGSSVPAMLAEVATNMGAAALAMAQEEIAEALSELKPDMEVEVVLETIYAGAHPEFVKGILGNEELMKAGARNAKKDAERIQKIHDNSVDLGAECSDAEKAAAKLAKRAETDPLLKAVLEERDSLKNQVTEAVDGIGELTKTMTTMREELKALRNEPAPMAPRTSVVGKKDDNQPGGAEPVDLTKAQDLINELSKTQAGQRLLAEAAIRASQSATT